MRSSWAKRSSSCTPVLQHAIPAVPPNSADRCRGEQPIPGKGRRQRPAAGSRRLRLAQMLDQTAWPRRVSFSPAIEITMLSRLLRKVSLRIQYKACVIKASGTKRFAMMISLTRLLAAAPFLASFRPLFRWVGCQPASIPFDHCDHSVGFGNPIRRSRSA